MRKYPQPEGPRGVPGRTTFYPGVAAVLGIATDPPSFQINSGETPFQEIATVPIRDTRG